LPLVGLRGRFILLAASFASAEKSLELLAVYNIFHNWFLFFRSHFSTGLKRYFHTKHEEGLLSGQGMRILDYCCGVAADHPEDAIDLWTSVEEEVGAWQNS
jgi:hypothetical protein